MLPRSMNPTMARVRREFESGSKLTFHDLEARCFIDARNAREYLKILYSDKEIRVASWRRDSPQGPWVPEYLWGPGEDAIKPHIQTTAERKRKRRLAQEVREREDARRRSKRTMKSVESIKSVVSFMLGIKDVS